MSFDTQGIYICGYHSWYLRFNGHVGCRSRDPSLCLSFFLPWFRKPNQSLRSQKTSKLLALWPTYWTLGGHKTCPTAGTKFTMISTSYVDVWSRLCLDISGNGRSFCLLWYWNADSVLLMRIYFRIFLWSWLPNAEASRRITQNKPIFVPDLNTLKRKTLDSLAVDVEHPKLISVYTVADCGWCVSARGFRNEASRCLGIFSRTLRFSYVASSPRSLLP